MKNVLAEILQEVTRPQLVAWESHCEHKLEVALKEQDKLKREYKTATEEAKKVVIQCLLESNQNCIYLRRDKLRDATALKENYDEMLHAD